MKTLTMDFDLYEEEILQIKNRGYSNAVNDLKEIWFELDGSKEFNDMFGKYDLSAYEFSPLRELILFINNKLGFKP